MHYCLFDIDGTLIHSGGAGSAAMKMALEQEFGITAPTEGIAMAGRTDRAIVADLFEFHEISEPETSVDRFLQTYLQHLPTVLKQLDGVILPGIGQLLRSLSERDDIVLGLLTGNFREGARIKLEHFELYKHFEFGGFGDSHDDRDDVAREALDEVHKRSNGRVAMDHVWVIGDTPADVKCGRAIGAQVIAVGTGFSSMQKLESAGPDHLFEDFSDTASLVRLFE